MKKILLSLLYIVAFGSFFSSCDVNVVNPNALDVSVFWKSETDAQNGLNAVYNMFYKDDFYSRWYWFRTNLTSDEGWSQSPWTELGDWTRFQYVNYNFNEGNVLDFHSCYVAIYRANQVLSYTPDITFADEQTKNQVLGQAYFLRALYYFDLAMLWGSENASLPIVLEPSQPNDSPAGHSETEVFAQVKSDLDQAINMLPASWDDANKGRATKGAAYALKAKAEMQEHNWQDAKNDLDWLVKGDGKQYYGLVSNYQDNFTHLNENNKESVFEIQYSDVHKAPAGTGPNDADPDLGSQFGQFFGPPGIGWTDGEMRPWLVDEYHKEKDINGNYDIRLKYNLFYEGMDKDFPDNDKIYGQSMDIWQAQNYKGRVFFRKYETDYYRDFEDYYSPINVRLIRYADVLLLYAECLANLSSSNLNEAISYVDQIRARVNMPPLSVNHVDATQSTAAFLKRLQMERCLEMCEESWRWADLQRWGLLDNQAGIDELKSRDPDFNNFVIGKNKRLPISSLEISNNPNLTQNPGY